MEPSPSLKFICGFGVIDIRCVSVCNLLLVTAPSINPCSPVCNPTLGYFCLKVYPLSSPPFIGDDMLEFSPLLGYSYIFKWFLINFY